MAIYGMGACYEGKHDKTNDFVLRGVACVGWPKKDAPAVHTLLERMQPSDIVYIKSFTPQAGLLIKAIGLVITDEVYDVPKLGRGRSITWVWEGRLAVGHIKDGLPVRSHTIYEELNIGVRWMVMRLLLWPGPGRIVSFPDPLDPVGRLFQPPKKRMKR